MKLNIGEQYAYKNTLYVSSMRTGYFIGTVRRPIPSQSFNDDDDMGLYWVFGSSPRKSITGKHNEFVFDGNLKSVYALSEIINFREARDEA